MQRLVRRQVASLVGGGLALIVLAVPAVAVGSHPPVGRIVAQSSKVQIQGELEDGDLTGSFRLRAAGASVPASDYYFFVGDLRGVNGTTGSVGREHVKLPDPLDLPAGGRRNFTLAVSALTRPGTYRGILKVIRIARPRSPAAPITIEIRATRRPAPRVIGGVPVKLTATKPIVPSLDTFLDPLLGYTQQAKVELDNPVTAHLPVHDGAADMRRDFDGRSPAIKLGPDEHRELSQWNATTDRTLVIRVSPTQEEPGRYTGEILIELVNIDTRFAIPTELNIKYGPLLPLGVLVASVVLGIGLRRLVRWFSARRRTRKSKDALTKRINDLQRDVEEIVAAATDLPGPQIPERPRGARVIELNADMEKYETRKANKGDAQKVARDVAEQLIAQLASARWLVVADAFSEATKVCDLVSDTVRTWQRMRNAWNTFRRMEPELDERARLEARRLSGRRSGSGVRRNYWKLIRRLTAWKRANGLGSATQSVSKRLRYHSSRNCNSTTLEGSTISSAPNRAPCSRLCDPCSLEPLPRSSISPSSLCLPSLPCSSSTSTTTLSGHISLTGYRWGVGDLRLILSAMPSLSFAIPSQSLTRLR